MTAIIRSSRGADGVMTTLTYELPSQTTPFAPSRQPGDEGTGAPSQCAISVFCRTLSYAAYSSHTAAHRPHPLEGQLCMGVQPTSLADSGGSWDGVGFEETCWPTNYFALFDDEWGILTGAPPPAAARTRGDRGDVPTAAFPGDRCLAGWTTACTTTVTAGASPLQAYYPQAWCCPPGRWSCATATADYDDLAPQRLCRSLLLVDPNSPNTNTDTDTDTDAQGSSSSSSSTVPGTEIWMTWDPPYLLSTRRAGGGGGGGGGTGDGWDEMYTWKASVPGETDPAHAATVFRKVFPLALSSGGGGGGTGRADGAETGAASPATAATATPGLAVGGRRSLFEDDSQQLLLSRGVVASFLGAMVATIAMSLVGFGLWRRSKRRRSSKNDNREAAALRDDGKYEVEILLKPDEVKLA
ncbi:NAD-dependent glutamate dehydrogenase [Hypoxylon texense]